MVRSNIFELLGSRWDVQEELARINRLFDEEDVIADGLSSYTLKEFVDTYCFEDWKNRGRYIDVDDYLQTLDFDGLFKRSSSCIENFITIIEIIYNFFYLAYQNINASNKWEYYSNFIILQNNMNMCLEHYNYAATYFEDKEQVIISEKDPVVTAAAEISDPETAFQIVQYNHYSLKGDIMAKKRILLYLASDLEPKRSTLKGINKTLSDDIFKLLNNLNIRHNNCDSQSTNYNEYVDKMTKETLENWYDELYQMILLAKLELDNIERKSKIAELISHF